MAEKCTQLKHDSDGHVIECNFIFTDTFDMNELKCIEIEPEMLDDLKNGQLEIRGGANDETVLVSSNKSYLVRQHDSSNTILLTSYNHTRRLHRDANDKENAYMHVMDDMEDNADAGECTESVLSAISCVYILEQQPPRLNELHDILYQRPYTGAPTPAVTPFDDTEHDAEHDTDDHKQAACIDLSFESLKLLAQCSDEELIHALDEIDAIQIQNEWRVIDEKYLSSCFQDVLYCVMEHSMDSKNLNIDDVTRNTAQFPHEMVVHCIRIHSVSRAPNEDGRWVLDEVKVSLFCAKQVILQQSSGEEWMRHSQFMQEWSDSLPYELTADVAILSGHFLSVYAKRCGENVWYILEEKELSLKPKERFQKLFAMKEQWNMQEITPYMTTLIKTGYNVDKLLLKHARMIRSKDDQGKELKSYISRTVKRK
mmetsp:Transcript_27103/g.44527  ORF Transcript_27103/g.44527 Transcript_27103/m.44527 type:complete len:426 (-) Transcript_27103:12-1289(-)